MITNQTDDKVIQFTPEQTASLEEYQARLSNLLSEIVNHTKILKGTRSECDRAVRERAYQEELLAELTPKVEEKRKQLDSYNEEINKATSDLAKLKEEIRVKTERQAEQDGEFTKREERIKDFEKVLSNQKATLDKRDDEHIKAFDAFAAKVAKLKEVLSTF